MLNYFNIFDILGDEWEKVSDINVNDNKNTQVSNQNKNVNKEDKKDVSNKPDKKSNDVNKIYISF